MSFLFPPFYGKEKGKKKPSHFYLKGNRNWKEDPNKRRIFVGKREHFSAPEGGRDGGRERKKRAGSQDPQSFFFFFWCLHTQHTWAKRVHFLLLSLSIAPRTGVLNQIFLLLLPVNQNVGKVLRL